MEELKQKLTSTVNVLKEEINSIQIGQVSETFLKGITLSYEDGRKNNILEVASVNAISNNALCVKPFDVSELSFIEKSIANAGLNVNTIKTHSEIKVTFPPLTEERRKELAKFLNAYSQKAKQSVRDLRHTFLNKNKKNSKEENLKQEKEVQVHIDKINGEIESIVEKKQQSIMKI